MDLVDALLEITADLGSAGIDYAVCGGIAVTIHGATRSTRDIDLLVRAEDVELVVDRLRDLGWRFRAVPMTFDAKTDKERRVHRVTRIEDGHALTVDLLEVGDAFADAFATRVSVDIGGRRLTAVSREGLGLLKRLAGRPQDLADLQKLGLDDG